MTAMIQSKSKLLTDYIETHRNKRIAGNVTIQYMHILEYNEEEGENFQFNEYDVDTVPSSEESHKLQIVFSGYIWRRCWSIQGLSTNVKAKNCWNYPKKLAQSI